MNDNPTLAKAIGADGAHIGQDDMDYFSSRQLLGKDAIIGVTCHNSKELAFSAANAGADYVAFGAFYETQTKAAKTRADLEILTCLLYTSPSPRDRQKSRMPSSA